MEQVAANLSDVTDRLPKLGERVLTLDVRSALGGVEDNASEIQIGVVDVLAACGSMKGDDEERAQLFTALANMATLADNLIENVNLLRQELKKEPSDGKTLMDRVFTENYRFIFDTEERAKVTLAEIVLLRESGELVRAKRAIEGGWIQVDNLAKITHTSKAKRLCAHLSERLHEEEGALYRAMMARQAAESAPAIGDAE